jgi:hypothetical protein
MQALTANVDAALTLFRNGGSIRGGIVIVPKDATVPPA